jgi:hypothetical protein
MPNPSERSNWLVERCGVRKVYFLHSPRRRSSCSGAGSVSMREPLRESQCGNGVGVTSFCTKIEPFLN